ncbi:MAG: NAD(+)/NADH kinase [Polyangiaceae bacterium]
MKKPRVLVLVKRTSFQTFAIERKDPRTLRLLAEKDPTVARLRSSHDSHQETVDEVREALEKLGASATVRVGPEKVVADGHALVVTVGGDGTLLVASHQVGPDTPIVGINSAPASSIGFFCAGQRGNVERTLGAALSGELPRVHLARMQVELNGAILHRRVLNDALFCHASPAATSRYILTLREPPPGGRSKKKAPKPVVIEQRSSGLWIGPAAGSTAAQRSAGGRVLPLGSKAIQVVVREGYVKNGKRGFQRGVVADGGELEIRSKMMDARLFLDGVHTMHEIALGDVITMRRSAEGLTVLGLRRR